MKVSMGVWGRAGIVAAVLCIFQASVAASDNAVDALPRAPGGRQYVLPAGPWTVTITASATSATEGSPVTLTAQANQDVEPTAYFVFIRDSRGSQVVSCGTGSFCSTTESAVAGTSETYKALISAADGTDVQATSDPITITWSSGTGGGNGSSGGASGAPTLTYPAAGSTQATLRVSLAWTNPAGTTQYQIKVFPAGNDGPALNLIRNADTSFSLSAPAIGQGPYIILPDMTYTWRVRATSAGTSVSENDTSWSAWSETRTFRTPKRTSANLIAVTPVDQARVGSNPQILQWNNGDSDVFYYEIQVSGDIRFDPNPATATSFVWWNLVHGGVTGPLNSWQTPSLAPDTTYYWRVRPRIQGDGTPANWSQTWSFKTQ